jgi:uncharacterized protein (TIGR00725 family)
MKIIGVIGGAHCSAEIRQLAFDVGCEIAETGNTLICGGLSGVMEAVCEGAKSRNGLTIGVLPGKLKDKANQWVDIPIVTGMGAARNVIIIRSSDSVIAIDGSYGTLSELAVAANLGVPVVGLQTWEIDIPIERVETAKQAVTLAIKLSRSRVDKERRTII